MCVCVCVWGGGGGGVKVGKWDEWQWERKFMSEWVRDEEGEWVRDEEGMWVGEPHNNPRHLPSSSSSMSGSCASIPRSFSSADQSETFPKVT